MSYRNANTIKATIKSYMESLNELLEYYQKVEPSSNESNQRTVLPTVWRPIGGNSDKIRKEANVLYAKHADLLEYGKAKYLKKGYWDYDQFFKVSWQLQIPFKIYEMEEAGLGYTTEDGKEIPVRPAKMVEFCSPHYLSLGEISGWAMKSWALPDWWSKHTEIESFMDDNPQLREQYREVVKKADDEVRRWQASLKEISELAQKFSNAG